MQTIYFLINISSLKKEEKNIPGALWFLSPSFIVTDVVVEPVIVVTLLFPLSCQACVEDINVDCCFHTFFNKVMWIIVMRQNDRHFEQILNLFLVTG